MRPSSRAAGPSDQRVRLLRVGLILLIALLRAGDPAPMPPSPPARAARAQVEAAPWWPGVQRHLAEREYWASEGAAGLQAPNRAHGLRTYFERTGIRVHDRTAPGSPQLVRLALAGVGRGAALSAVAAGDLVAQESRVEIRRPGLLEWYVNSLHGLEQGFTLDERPAGDGPLVVEMTVAGAQTTLRTDAVLFATQAC